MNPKSFRLKPFDILAITVLASVGAAVGAVAMTPETTIVSQKGRQFQPGEISVSRGQTVVIVNDDGDLLHHAYIESDNFNFDSGDQQPGSRTPITFSVPGEYKVLCGIHPKMKLTVQVR